jgi:hypothetical protein
MQLISQNKKKHYQCPPASLNQPTHAAYTILNLKKHQFLSYVVSDEHTTRQSHNRIRQSSSLNLLHEVETAE